MAEMSERELKAIVQSQIRNSSGHLGGSLSEANRKALGLYMGDPIGNEVDGRSQVVSSDTQDAVEAVLPDLMGVFGATDKLAEFDPVGSEDEDMADQASDYVNHIFYKDNEGFLILHDWVKSALLSSTNSITKTYFDTRETTETENYEGLSTEDMQTILKPSSSSETIDPIRHTEHVSDESKQVLEQLGMDPDIKPEELQQMLLADGTPEPILDVMRQIVLTHDIEIKRTKKVERIVVENIPPEEFLISRRALSLDNAALTGHGPTNKTVSELIEMGFSAEKLKGIPSGDETEFGAERTTRFGADDEYFRNQGMEADESMREIRVYELYMKVDWDGTGKAQLRKVTVAGPAYEILDNESVSEHPFEALTAIRMPHKFHGRSLADLVKDITLIKTALNRAILDNAYAINNARPIIGKKVELEDVLNNRVASPIRVDADMVAGHIDYMQTVPIGSHLFPVIEYFDRIGEKRTGVSALSQGLDPNALDSTAGGINMLLGRSQRRILMMAQMMAAMGVKRLAMKILRTAIRHQNKPRVIKIRGEWVEMDPRTWNIDMDVTVNVGLGTGTQENQQAGMMLIGQVQEKLIQLQGGANGPLVGLHQIRAAASKLGETIGLKTIDPYVMEVEEGAQIEQREDPRAAMAQAEMQMKGQIAQAEMQLKAQGQQSDAEEAAHKLTLDREKAAAQMVLDKDKAQAEIDLKREIAQAEINLKREMAGLDAQVKLADIELKRETTAAEIIQKGELGAAERDMHERHHQGTMKASESANKASTEPQKGNGKDKAPVINVTVGGAKKNIKIERDSEDRITGGSVSEE